MCIHTSTKAWKWFGRDEIICTACGEVMWHEDKPMTWNLDGEILVTFEERENA
jgi:hypothetical protein